MNSIVLPAGWERHAAPGATLLDPLGPPLLFWIGAALMLLLAVVLAESRPALAIVLALLSALALAIAGNGLVDDAYIQFRYAANVTEGHGPVFNPGERIEGASGGIWIGVIALASLVTGQDAVLCGRILSLAAAILATLAAAAFGAATGGRRRAALLAILWAALPTASLYAATGLEGMVLALSAAPLWRRLGGAGRAALTGALFGALVIAAARLVYFGFPVPRSALVKGVTAAAGLDSGFRYLGRVAFEWWPLLPALAWIALHARRLVPILLPATLWTCLVRSPDTVLPSALSSVADETDPLRDYRQVTILHSPEYRLDFLRDAFWIRKDRGPIPEAAGSSQGFGGLAARTSRRSAP